MSHNGANPCTSKSNSGRSRPLVSIGMPVYNGDNYIAAAIDSIRAQTFDDFEMIITDNGSTDRTPGICQDYAAGDPRIKYHRNERNLGAARNYNRAFQLATGTYFKWAAHDDVIAPNFLTECVAVLERDPSVALCSPQVTLIDAEGNCIEEHNLLPGTDAEAPAERFRALMRMHRCYEVFGLIRANALRQTHLIGSYGNADAILLAVLGLYGRFYSIPERLLMPRMHAGQSMAVYGCYQEGRADYYAYTAWYDTSKAGRPVFPHWAGLRDYLVGIWRAPLSWRDRVRCYRILGHWTWTMKGFLKQNLTVAAAHVLDGPTPLKWKGS